jgi:hypothetical protein
VVVVSTAAAAAAASTAAAAAVAAATVVAAAMAAAVAAALRLAAVAAEALVAATTTSRSEARWRLGIAAFIALSPVSGCVFTVQLESLPTGARVTLPDGGMLLTPAPLVVHAKDKGMLLVEAPGYEPLPVSIARTERGLLRAWSAAVWRGGRREVTFVLQPIATAVGAETTAP